MKLTDFICLPSIKGIRRQIPVFWALLTLFLIQCGFAIYFHNLLTNLVVADSLLLILVIYRSGTEEFGEASSLLHRSCACVAFCGVLFVNTTHALEMLSSAAHKDDDDEDHVHEEESTAKIFDNVAFVGLCGVDISVKMVLVLGGYAPALGLPKPLRYVLHMLVPGVSFVLFFVSTHVGFAEHSWLFEHLDPLAGILLAIASFLLIIPAFRELKPYIFADHPSGFSVEDFKREIADQFTDAECSHIHVYRLWPGTRFEALIHINIKVDKTETDWSPSAAERFNAVSKHIRSALVKGGASNVTIEPRFVDSKRETPVWLGCVDSRCHADDRGCCRPNGSPLLHTAA